MRRNRYPFALLGSAYEVIRRSQKLSQPQIASRCDVSRQTVHSWETGRTCPSFLDGVRLLNALQATVDDLVDTLALLRRLHATVGDEMKEKRPEKKRRAGEKPVSLDPLDFEDALRALLKVKPENRTPENTSPARGGDSRQEGD